MTLLFFLVDIYVDGIKTQTVIKSREADAHDDRVVSVIYGLAVLDSNVAVLGIIKDHACRHYERHVDCVFFTVLALNGL